MKLSLLVVGRAGPLVAAAIADYEQRARRYWNLEVIEVKQESARKSLSVERVREAESHRLMERVPASAEVIALARDGQRWSSTELAGHLEALAVQGSAGAAFLIGGALGLSARALKRSDRRLSLSAMTLTHELARLVLMEQLYRAGTIIRGEPYHKART